MATSHIQKKIEIPTIPLRAYLASALTDLSKDDRDRVYEISRQLKALCALHGVALYLPFEHTDPVAHSDIPAPQVYERDRKQVVTSDFLLVLCAAASYGVGQENEIAANHGVPVAYLIQKGSRVSRMLLGSDTRKVVIEYENTADLLAQIKEFLLSTTPALTKKRESIGATEPLGIGQRIRDLRERTNVPRKSLTDLMGVDEQRLVRVEEHSQEEGSLTVGQLRDLANYLNVDISYVLLGATSAMDERTRRSRDNLKGVAREEGMMFQEFEDLWEGFLKTQRQKIGFTAATRDNFVVSKEQWRGWYRQMLDRRNGLALEF
jgi:transcriptional regulator with XRE-family HTH domain/nucleoside 2-deoxyribosyltransferase